MPNQNPDHLLDRAETAIRSGRFGSPRQTDLRRAVSDAYYAAFHAILTAAADAFVGRRHRGSRHYGLVYRSVDHRAIRELCQTVRLTTPSQKYRPYIPVSGFDANLRDVAGHVLALQRQRNTADYDPTHDVSRSEAQAAVSAAREALACWHAASATERDTFLHLLLFPPR